MAAAVGERMIGEKFDLVDSSVLAPGELAMMGSNGVIVMQTTGGAVILTGAAIGTFVGEKTMVSRLTGGMGVILTVPVEA